MSESSPQTTVLKAALICITAALFCSYQFLLQGAPAVMVSPLTVSFGLTMTELGLLSSSFLYTYLICQIPGGYLADRYNLRLVLVLCCLLMALACYGFSIADNLATATLARALMGLATAPSIVISMTLVSRWFPDKWFPPLAGLVETSALAGGALGPVLIPELMAMGGWRQAMVWLALLGVVLAVLIGLFVRNVPPGKVPEVRVSSHGGLALLIRQKCFWLCCLYGFGLFAVLTCFGSLWGVPFLCERFPTDQPHAPHAIALLFAGAGIGAPAIGLWASASGRYQQLMGLSALVSLLITGLVIYLPCSLWVMDGLCFLAGLSCGGYMLVFAVVRKVCPRQTHGIALAAVNACLLLGGPVLQPLVGALLSGRQAVSGEPLLGAYQWAFLPLLVVQLLSLLAVFGLSGIDDKKDCQLPHLSR